MYKRRCSLTMKSSLVLLAALTVSVLFYYTAQYAADRLLDEYFQVSVYIERATDKAAASLQKYVSDNQIASGDISGLNKWSRKNLLVYYVIEADGKVAYASYYADDETLNDEDFSGEEMTASALDEYYINDSREYEIKFTDIVGTVYMSGFFEYQFYQIAHYAELGASVLLFFLIFLFFLQRKLKYVRQLEKEVKILEGGGMDKEITVKGMDELSELAFGLNEMRLRLNENIKAKEELLEVNNRLVTGMAHDLRTPLTSLLLYTELLEKKKYRDEKELETYLEKTARKANQIKRMSDQLFERFYVTGYQNVSLEPPQSLLSVFEGRISDLMMFLESQGFTVDCGVSWEKVKISVVSEYIDRILDNITSNLMKYADRSVPVEITIKICETTQPSAAPGNTYLELKFKNKIRESLQGVKSTQVGVNNVKQMTEKMQGICTVLSDGTYYEIRILLPVV